MPLCPLLLGTDNWQFSQTHGSLWQHTQELEWEKMQSNHIVHVNIPLTIFLSLMEAPHLTSLPTSRHPQKKYTLSLLFRHWPKVSMVKMTHTLKNGKNFLYCFSIHCLALMKLLNDTREYKTCRRNKHCMTCGRVSNSSGKTSDQLVSLETAHIRGCPGTPGLIKPLSPGHRWGLHILWEQQPVHFLHGYKVALLDFSI